MADSAVRSYPVIAVGREPAPPRQPSIDLTRHDLSAPADQRLVLLTDPHSPRARAYRLLRHRLLGDGDPRVIVVTSALPGEGKTTCAANLALAIAEETASTALLFDANLVRPAAAGLFQIEAPKGLLEDDARSYSVIAPSSRLRVALALGQADPAARIDRTRIRQVVGDLAQSYDYVIIDAASVLESVSVNVLAELAEGVVITARARFSERRNLRRAVAELAPARVLGLALIDV